MADPFGESFEILPDEPDPEGLVRHVMSLGVTTCEGDHADCAPDEDGWHAFTFAHCGAAV